MSRLIRALFITVALFFVVAPVAASVPGFTYQGSARWTDDKCGITHFNVRVSLDEFAGGADTNICGNWYNFCDVPLSGAESTPCFIDNGLRANDRVSSIYTASIDAGWDVCLYTDAGYTGSKFRLYSANSDIDDLGSWADRFSSARARQEGTPC